MVELFLTFRIILIVLFPFILWHLKKINIWRFDKFSAGFVYGFLSLDFISNVYRVYSYFTTVTP